MAGVASLRPETAAEGRLAAQFVAADAWAMDCLRLAGERRLEFEVARKCRAQAMSMMREGKSALRALQRLQAARRAVDGDEAAANRAAWAEHGALRMMAEALAPAPAASAPASAVPAATRQGGDDEEVPVTEARGSEARMSGPVSCHGIDVRIMPRETEPGFWPVPGQEAESPGVTRSE